MCIYHHWLIVNHYISIGGLLTLCRPRSVTQTRPSTAVAAVTIRDGSFVRQNGGVDEGGSAAWGPVGQINSAALNVFMVASSQGGGVELALSFASYTRRSPESVRRRACFWPAPTAATAVYHHRQS